VAVPVVVPLVPVPVVPLAVVPVPVVPVPVVVPDAPNGVVEVVGLED
jgi:signal-induced proliferation-associated 1 like protein 3